MRARILWLLLAVSLALNLGLAGGAFYFQSEAERLASRSDEGFDGIARSLALSERQRADLLALRERVGLRRAAVMSSRDQRRAAVLEELAKPELDRARLAEIFDSGTDERLAFIQDTMADLHALLATFSPEQKEDFLALAQERYFLRRLFGFGPGRERSREEASAQARN